MDVKEMCEKVLEDHNIPTKYLDKVLEKHFRSKKWISETFGLTAENDYRIVLPLNESLETRPMAAAIIKRIECISPYRALDLGFMWKGKNKARISKVLNELKNELLLWRWDESHSDMRALLNEVNVWRGVSDTFYTNGGVEISIDKVIHKIQVWYGDYVKNGRVAVLSINPFDFFTCSDREGGWAGFSSCLRPGGEYFNGVLVNLASPHCAIMYISEPERINFKIGRVWVYVNETAVHQGRSAYGSIFDHDLLLVRSWMHEKLGGKWLRRRDGLQAKHVTQLTGIGYLDWGCGDYTHKEGVTEVRFEFKMPICLQCGKEFAYGNENGVCSDCGDKVCYHCFNCDCAIDDEEDTRWYHDDCYCEDCFNDMFTYCNSCENYYPDDEVRIVCTNRGKRYYCDSCLGDTAECYHCEELHTTDILTEVDGEYYCEDCLESVFKRCEECDELFKKDELHSGYCDDCLEELGDEAPAEDDPTLSWSDSTGTDTRHLIISGTTY